MRTEPEHDRDPADDPLIEMGYEQQDVSMRRIGQALWWFFGFAVFCIVASLGTLFLLKPEVFSRPVETTAPFTARTPEPPNPILQTNVTSKTDMKDIRRREREMLTTTAWINESRGTVRIPIERAIDLVAQRGVSVGRSVPAASNPQADQPGGAAQP